MPPKTMIVLVGRGHVAGIESNRFPYLCGEFPCGDEYQGANTKGRLAIALQRLLQKWQSEGSCLA